MCIATVCKIKDEFFLTHNRDEHIERAFHKELNTCEIENQEVVYPLDIQSQGTWMVNSSRFSGCILNGGIEFHNAKPHHTQSRGKLLLDILSFASIQDFVEKTSFTYTQPFTLVLIEKSTTTLYLIIWNDDKVIVEEKSLDKPFIWLSSTLYSTAKKEEITQNFLTQVFQSGDEVWNWHQKHQMQLGDAHPKIKTVCTSQINVKNNNLGLRFEV